MISDPCRMCWNGPNRSSCAACGGTGVMVPKKPRLQVRLKPVPKKGNTHERREEEKPV